MRRGQPKVYAMNDALASSLISQDKYLLEETGFAMQKALSLVYIAHNSYRYYVTCSNQFYLIYIYDLNIM